jgi:hypothetical protein
MTAEFRSHFRANGDLPLNRCPLTQSSAASEYVTMPQFINDSRSGTQAISGTGPMWASCSMLPAVEATVRELVVSNSPVKRYMLWIDGVGAWQICLGSSFSIGAPTFESESADITLLANISRQHASIVHEADQWRVVTDHATTISGRTVTSTAGIRSGDQLCLANRVKLGFRIPSVLSSSAVIDFESNHRPEHTVDGIILMVDHCLLGPRHDQHICCPDWPDVVVLYVQDGMLRCRSAVPLQVDGKPVSDSAPLRHGAIVDGEDLRFRIEEIR